MCLSLLALAGCPSKSGDRDEAEKKPPAPVAERKREVRFETAPAMYAANEEWLTFACELPDGQTNVGSAKAVEMYWYSRYGLGNLLFRSGMGVHMVYNPLFKKHTNEDKGMPWYQKPDGPKIFMHHKMGQFVKRTGADQFAKAQFPAKGAFPIFLEFSSGVPSFVSKPQMNDFSTLRWDPAKMDKSMSPAAWGQTLSKQILWARDFFTNHREEGGVTYLGNAQDDGGNGFRGAVLTAMAITKSFALKSQLAYHASTGALGGVDPATYKARDGAVYWPHRYKVEFGQGMPGMPPPPARFVVLDKGSDLFDLASLLWAESEFYYFTDPTVEDDYDLVFGDPKWSPKADRKQLLEQFSAGKTIFPLGPHKLSKGLTIVNLKNIGYLHYDRDAGTLFDRWEPGNKRGKHISTHYAGMAMVALANAYARLHDVPPMRKRARKFLATEADFLQKHQEADGSFASGFDLEGGVAAESGPKTLLAQSFAIRGLLAAYTATHRDRYLDSAKKAYGFMVDNLWSEDAQVFRSEVGAATSTYDGYNFGATLGALRELAIADKAARREVVAKLDAFFENVAQKKGLQLSELGQTGESMKDMTPDSDGDGVPKPPFAGGKFGTAPVQASNLSLPTP